MEVIKASVNTQRIQRAVMDRKGDATAALSDLRKSFPTTTWDTDEVARAAKSFANRKKLAKGSIDIENLSEAERSQLGVRVLANMFQRAGTDRLHGSAGAAGNPTTQR